MGGTIRNLRFAVTVEDYQHWAPEHLAAAEAAGIHTYDDWAVDQLEDVMLAAGQRYIDDHPDMFRDGLT